MSKILESLSKLFKLPKLPVGVTPKQLVLFGVPQRRGLQAAVIASRIIQRKAEAGLPVGNLDNGQPNPDEVMIRIMVEEILRALEQEAIIEVAIRPGDRSMGFGANSGGPVQVTSTQVTIGKGYGIIK